MGQAAGPGQCSGCRPGPRRVWSSCSWRMAGGRGRELRLERRQEQVLKPQQTFQASHFIPRTERGARPGVQQRWARSGLPCPVMALWGVGLEGVSKTVLLVGITADNARPPIGSAASRVPTYQKGRRQVHTGNQSCRHNCFCPAPPRPRQGLLVTVNGNPVDYHTIHPSLPLENGPAKADLYSTPQYRWDPAADSLGKELGSVFGLSSCRSSESVFGLSFIGFGSFSLFFFFLIF